VCLCMCVQKYVSKVIDINKYKQNRDDVTCSINVETETDVYINVKQAFLILVAFMTGNSSLEPLLEGLFAQIHIDLS